MSKRAKLENKKRRAEEKAKRKAAKQRHYQDCQARGHDKNRPRKSERNSYGSVWRRACGGAA